MLPRLCLHIQRNVGAFTLRQCNNASKRNSLSTSPGHMVRVNHMRAQHFVTFFFVFVWCNSATHYLSATWLCLYVFLMWWRSRSLLSLCLCPHVCFVIHGIAICVVHWPIFRWRHCPPPFPSNNSHIVSVHLNRSYGRESRIYRVSSLFSEFRMNINISTLCHICGHRYRSELHILIFVLRFGCEIVCYHCERMICTNLYDPLVCTKEQIEWRVEMPRSGTHTLAHMLHPQRKKTGAKNF